MSGPSPYTHTSPPVATERAAASFGPASSGADDSYTLLHTSHLGAPSSSQLAALRAVPLTSSLLQGRAGRPKKGGKKISRSVFFNEIAGRPRIVTSRLEQGITVQMTFPASTILITSTTVPTYSSLSFALNNFNLYTEYTGLFDQYRIEKLQCWIEPVAAQGTTVFNSLASAVDLDNSATPVSFQAVAGKQESLVGLGGAGRYHEWQPHMAVATYSGAFTSYGNVRADWIDSASPGVAHYGLKLAALATSAAAITYQLSVTATVSFKAPGV